MKSIEIRCPRDGERVRVKPYSGAEVTLHEDGGEYFLITERVVAEAKRLHPERVKKMMIFLTRNEEDHFFLWPVPSPVGEDHPAFRAMSEWVCLYRLH